jgi:pimeloyl-ACP methyl ester carboxylesterase
MRTTSLFRVTPVACALFALTTVRPIHAQDVPTVFIHGLASSGATWEGAADRLQTRLSITPYRPNLIWRSTFESQGDGLQAQLGWLPASTVAVGHSNGGLTARQWSRLHPLNGIVTLGTPNQGAPLAYNALSWIWFDFNAGSVITDIFNAFGRDCCDWYWILSQVGEAADWVRYWLSLHPAAMASTLGIEFGAPVLGQMASDSPANLNSPDNLNREASVVPSRVGISVVAHNFYWAGPFRAIWPEWGDGIATVMYAASTGLNYWATYLWTTADPGDTRAMDLANALWNASAWITWIDPAWCNYVSVAGGSFCTANDTVVPEWSQVYPAAFWIRIPDEGPAHIQETSQSDDVLYTALTNVVGIPPRGSSSGGGGGGSSALAVSLRADNGQFVVAEGGGGGMVNANRNDVGPWETFTLFDLNGGTLMDGDPVAFQTNSSHYLQAVWGGGDTMLAVGGYVGPWETFTLVDLDRPGGAVQSWDAIALQGNYGYFVVAEQGGGDVVNANRTWIGPWETFRLFVH